MTLLQPSFVASGYGQQEVKGSDFMFLQQADLLGVSADSQYIQLL